LYLKFIIHLIGVSLFLSSCQSSNDSNTAQKKGKLLASVSEHQLYERDLEGMISVGVSSEDSITITNSYIQKWIREMLWIKEAQENLKSNAKSEIESKIEAYKADLWVHAFEEQYLEEKLGEKVKDADIQSFYEENNEDFVLKSPLVKVYWVTLPSQNDQKETLKLLLSSNKPDDSQKLKEYCIKFAQSYQINDSLWYNLEEVLQSKGFGETQNKEQFLVKNGVFEQSSSENITYLLIRDFKPEGSTAPLEAVKARIKTQIMNRNKVKLLQDLEKELFEKAQKQKTYKIYE
jgi:hypothetical protein